MLALAAACTVQLGCRNFMPHAAHTVALLLQVPLNSTACGSTASLDLSCPGTCDMPQCKKPLAQDGYCSCLQCDNDLLMLDDFQCKSVRRGHVQCVPASGLTARHR